MTHEERIHEILIDRDVRAFVDGDWASAAADFDAVQFTGYSGADGLVRLDFPTLDAYRDSWISQSAEFAVTVDPALLESQLAAAQWIERIEIGEDRALAVKKFDGAIDLRDGTQRSLRWTTYYFLRFDAEELRWLITGFMGYLPSEWNAS